MGSTGVPMETKGRSAFELWVDCYGRSGHRDELRRAVVAHGTSPGRGGGVDRGLWLALRLADMPNGWYGDVCADVSAWYVPYSRQDNMFYWKDVPETSGPGSCDVPDKVWRALTPLVNPERDGYAAEWRRRVTEFRASLPAGVRRSPRPGETVEFDGPAWGDELGTTFTFAGRSVFVRPDGYRVRLRGWSTVGVTVTGKAA